jgi:hypothetical protein
VWFETPEKALADPIRFIAYAMTYALPEDMRFIWKYVSDDDFRDAIDHAPAGIIDPRSWAYWNSKMGRYPPPPQPVRRLAGPSSAEEQRRHGVRAWLRIRQEASKLDPAEIRRRAAQKWRAEFGPKKQD